MKIEIKSQIDAHVIISGEYASVKKCLEKNRVADLGGADLRGADLGDADLRGAYLGGADLRGDYLRDADLRGAYLRGADLRDACLRGACLRGAYLGGADLRDAYLRDADLGGADLRGADLGGADLGGAKNYRDSHYIFTEIIRRQQIKVFVDLEWSAIAQITIHRLCWDAIKKRFSDVVPGIFQKLADAGFDEWLKYWNEINK